MADPKSPFVVGNGGQPQSYVRKVMRRREWAIEECMRRGLEPKQIAFVIGVTEQTLSRDLSHLRVKHDVTTNHLLAIKLCTGKRPEVCTRGIADIKLDIWESAD